MVLGLAWLTETTIVFGLAGSRTTADWDCSIIFSESLSKRNRFIFLLPASRTCSTAQARLFLPYRLPSHVSLWADSGPPRMNTIAPRDQFKPIRIGENLVVNYNEV